MYVPVDVRGSKLILHRWRIGILAKTELPHHPLLGHLLHLHIEDDLRFCHPVRHISCAEIRDPVGVPFRNGSLCVRLPDHLTREQRVKLLGQ